MIKSGHTSYGLGKNLNWICKDCGVTYFKSADFNGHLCQQKKNRHNIDPDVQPVKYTRKTVDKQIHKEAKKWSLPIMYSVAFEEKWCLPGDYLLLLLSILF